MATFITVIQFFAGLSILIILHELGHFLAAKYFGVRVIKFYLFFDFLFPFPEVAKFSLFKKTVGETEYGIGWFPFGGYVQMAGIMDESMDEEALKQPAQPDEFRSKPAWQRLIILLGGIIVNVLVAFVLYSILAFGWGDSYLAVDDQVHGIYCDSTALDLGLKNGDIITHVNGKKVENADKVKIEMLFALADNITYVRNGQEGQIVGIDKLFYKNVIDNPEIVLFETATLSVVDTITNEDLKASGLQKGDRIIAFEGKPVAYQQDLALLKKGYENKEVSFSVLRGADTLNLSASLDDKAMFGFGVNMDEFKMTHRSYNFFQAIVAGPVKTWNTLKFYIAQFKLMFDPVVKGYRQIGGFGTIAQLYSGGFSWYAFLSKTAFISIVLAFMNLLPIPALDGGHAVFTIYEMVFRRPMPEKVMYYAQIAGMVLLFGLLIYANGNDLFRWFTK
ncbi:MAG: RIP metalloprotease RseP [Chitinophagales bacterium]|nr:RIP metalloprotease RseP [Chitinophagales bacterium]